MYLKYDIIEGGIYVEEKFLNYMLEEKLSENSYKSYLQDVEKFKKYYFNSYGEELKELIHSDISMYINYLKKNGYIPTSINRNLSALKKYNLFLIKENIQDNIVITKKDYIKIQSLMMPKEEIPKPQEINKLKHFALKDLKNPERDFCLICIFSYGGLRESELVKIRIVDVKLEDRFINIIGKGNKFRQIIINQIMYDAINDYLKVREKVDTKNPYLFIGQKNKNNMKPLCRDFCNRVLNKYKDLCKINNLHPHLLRSYFCSNALHNAGYSIEQVANQAGHSSLNTTRMYLSTSKEDLIDLANKL